MTDVLLDRAERPRDRALCCQCGQLRTVAPSRRGMQPASARAAPDGRWCTWLRCAHCRATTVHALIVEAMRDAWWRDGCDRERHDRLADRHRRRIARRLRALAAEGVTIVRVTSVGDMTLDNSLVEIIEYADPDGSSSARARQRPRRFLIRACTSATPVRLLQAVDRAEDLLDAPDQLGQWAIDGTGVWRGVALTDT